MSIILTAQVGFGFCLSSLHVSFENFVNNNASRVNSTYKQKGEGFVI